MRQLALVVVGGCLGIGALWAAAEVPTIKIAVSHSEKDYTCHGDDVSITGNEDVISVSGQCGKVRIDGDQNVVRLQEAAQIVATGNENAVYWKTGNPAVSDSGKENVIKRKD